MVRFHWLTISLLVLATASLASAAEALDPPSRVARLNYLSGTVSFQPGGLDNWVPAVVNRPLTTGDQMWVDDGARAELHIGSTVFRVASATSFDILNLSDNSTQIKLSVGLLTVRVRHLDDQEALEVDTPQGSISVLRPGEYRIEARSDGQVTIVTSRGGDAEVNGGGSAFTLHPRQTARLSGADSMTYDVTDARPRDGWDDWCLQRDQREDRAASNKYVSREMIGYEDLDENGSWRDVPGYGAVWTPRVVVAGWAPYRYGHWAWVEPWGWTWVDDAPWGFAPFHYGRWAFVQSSWVWVPGAVVARPVYAPALVAFVGGAHFSLSISVGGGSPGVAWFPLGPREAYVPAYHVSPTYVRNVNITHVTNITNVTNVTNVNVTNNNTTNVRYVNQTVPGAMTAVSSQAFTGSRPVAQAAVPVNAQMAASAQVQASAAVAPRPSSVMGMNAERASSAARPPAGVMNRQVVVKTAPPAAPVAFSSRQPALQANPGRPVDPQTMSTLQQSQRSVRPQIVRRQLASPVQTQSNSAPAIRPNRPTSVDAVNPTPNRPPLADVVHPNPNRPAAVEAVNPRPIHPASADAVNQRPVRSPATAPAAREIHRDVIQERKAEQRNEEQLKRDEHPAKKIEKEKEKL